ncbi:MAG: galactose-1-phosphate uridylyltransferase, partial [Candidatus Hydrogenedentota bacterium]
YCVFALYTKDEKPDVCLSCFLLLLDIIRVTAFSRGDVTMPEWRKDPVTSRWVIIATERGKRPSDFGSEDKTRKGGFCPLCEGNEVNTPPEVLGFRKPGTKPNEPGWWVRVVPNKFPILLTDIDAIRKGEGMYDKIAGFGCHEIIVETSDHNQILSLMNSQSIEEVLWAFHNRLRALSKDERLKYVQIFKNHGRAAGGLLEHSHSQLIGTPVIPKRIKEEIYGAKYHYDYKERCVYCDMIDEEERGVKRIIAMNEEAVSFCPFASRFPFESWVLPRKHFHSFDIIGKKEISGLAEVLRETLARIYRVLENSPYNLVLHTSPLRTQFSESYHFHFEIIPKLTIEAGFELGTGFFINPTPPEEAAAYLRQG